jgi:hypothetical protein
LALASLATDRGGEMADLDVVHEEEVRESYTMLEVVFWLVGILMIPLVPIVMVALFTPHSGM